MFKKTLSKAINYYDEFNYLTIVNKDGIVEYSAIYCNQNKSLINEAITGIHILDVYPDLGEENSTIIKSLKMGKEIYNTLQELTDLNNRSYYLLSTDFPIVSNNSILGVIEVSVEIDKERYLELLSNNSFSDKPKLVNLDNIITQDKDFIALKNNIDRISKTDSSVLIVGNTGTGKDMVAQSIHSHSYRCYKPFVSQNCAAIPPTLLESTFFGTVKGAYTGAENMIGLFELAHEGTLFLDEINSMDIGLQAKILRAIEEKTIRRVGCTKNRKIDVRIISAMNIRPEDAIKEKKLREDLFYRLGVIRITIPPLRNRRQDIPLLTEHFINKYNKEMGKNVEGATELAKNILYNYDWSGNVRELQNVIESSFNVLSGEKITVQDLPDYLYQSSDHYSDYIKENNKVPDVEENTPLQEKLENYEQDLIKSAIVDTSTLADAARQLQISAQSLQYKLKKYNLDPNNI